MTHVKNVEGFGKLVDFCSGYGGKYNPGSPNLQLNQLNVLLVQAMQALHTAKAAKTGYDQQANNREIVFQDIRKLASRVVLTLAASGASAQTVKDARSFLRLMYGRRAEDPAPVAGDTTAPASIRTRSISRQDFASQIDHLASLILTVSAEPKYQPNESEFTKEGLNAKVAQLRTLNQDATTARMQWSNARIERNRVLYTDPNALYGTANAVKMYVKAVYGHSSEQYRQVSSLVFTKPRI
jgi:hypothetical protein